VYQELSAAGGTTLTRAATVNVGDNGTKAKGARKSICSAALRTFIP
jgi:hypothetical protein